MKKIERLIPHDAVNKPVHYTQGKTECIDSIKELLGDGFGSYCKGTIAKYMWRYQDKNGVEDLKKAEWYLKALIKFEEETHARTIRKIQGGNAWKEKDDIDFSAKDAP
jgi:hypothetical protein